MGTCYCTGRCRQGFPCAAYPNGYPSDWPDLETGKTWEILKPLTEEDVRRIVREEIERGR